MANTNAAATITKTSAPVTVERGGQSITLNQGNSVFQTDVIKTQDASLELKFADGTMVILSPNSTLTIQEFSYDAVGESSFVVNLAAGSMRSISSKVVEQNPDAFKVVTLKTTVDISGTDLGSAIHADGTESVVLFAIDPAHNLLITTHSGAQISLTTAHQGAYITADTISPITLHDFTEEEMYDFMGKIFASTDKAYIEEEHRKILEAEELGVIEGDTNQVALLLDQALVKTLGEANNTALLELAGYAIGTSGDIYLEDIGPFAPYPPVFGVLDGGSRDTDTGDDHIDDDDGITQVDGGSNYYADAEFYNTPGATHNLIDNTLNIVGDIGNGLVISGDAGDITEGTVNAGNDTITGGNITAGLIVGDAHMVGANALVNFGNDSITLESKTGDGSIYGDAHTIAAGATASFGDDAIIKGEFANVEIVGDVLNDLGAIVSKWGNDTISVDSMNATAANTYIYGDSRNSTTVGGHDSITVLGTMTGNVTAGIIAGGGDDTIHVGTLGANATIFGDDGNDIISVDNFAGGNINGGAGTDRFVWNAVVGAGATQTIDDLKSNGNITDVEQFAFQNLAGGTIEGTTSADAIFVYNASGGTVNTDVGNDTTTFTGAVGGHVAVNNSGGTDNLYLNNGIEAGASVTLTGDFNNVKQDATNDLNFNAGTLNLSNTTNSITLASMSGTAVLDTADGATVNITGNMNGGRIDGGADNDSITIGGIMSNGTLNLGAGTNTVSIDALQGGTINGGSGTTTTTLTQAYSGNATITSESATQHSVTLSGGMTGGNLTLIALNNSTGGFNVNGAGGGFDMSNGTVNGSYAKDTISITNMNNGSIYGDRGDDSISITSMFGGNIAVGEGADILNVTIGNIGDKGDATIDLTDIDNAVDTINFGTVAQNGTKVTVKGFEAGEDVINYNGTAITKPAGATEYTTSDGNLIIYFT